MCLVVLLHCVEGDQTSASPVSPWCHLPVPHRETKTLVFASVPRTNCAVKVNMLDILCRTGLEQHPDYSVTWAPLSK